MHRRSLTHNSSRTTFRRSGAALYIIVLANALVVSILGMTALTIGRVQRQHVSSSTRLLDARTSARSAVELALQQMAIDSSWRTKYKNGVESSPQKLNSAFDGTVSWIIDDTDGSIADGDTDLRIRGIGRVGDAVQVSQVRIRPSSGSLAFLETVMHAGGNIDFPLATVGRRDVEIKASGGPISSDGTVTNFADVDADVDAARVIDKGEIGGIVTEGSFRGLPSAAVWDVYRPYTTTIDVTSLPFDKKTSTYSLEPGLLGPLVNPYGFPSFIGFYHLSIPAKTTLWMDKSRFRGTLVVEGGPGSVLHVGGEILLERVDPSFPIMIVKGCDVVELDSRGNGGLSESAIGQNLNPLWMPYQGSWDFDQNDKYHSEFRGLIHIIGAKSQLKLFGSIHVTGTIVTDGSISYPFGTDRPEAEFTWDEELLKTPPFGYNNGGSPENVADSWTWDPAP